MLDLEGVQAGGPDVARKWNREGGDLDWIGLDFDPLGEAARDAASLPQPEWRSVWVAIAACSGVILLYMLAVNFMLNAFGLGVDPIAEAIFSVAAFLVVAPFFVFLAKRAGVMRSIPQLATLAFIGFLPTMLLGTVLFHALDIGGAYFGIEPAQSLNAPLQAERTSTDAGPQNAGRNYFVILESEIRAYWQLAVDPEARAQVRTSNTAFGETRIWAMTYAVRVLRAFPIVIVMPFLLVFVVGWHERRRGNGAHG